jgi:hypothetical protein
MLLGLAKPKKVGSADTGGASNKRQAGGKQKKAKKGARHQPGTPEEVKADDACGGGATTNGKTASTYTTSSVGSNSSSNGNGASKAAFWGSAERREALLAKVRAALPGGTTVGGGGNGNGSSVGVGVGKVVISETVNYAGKATAVEKKVDATSEEARRALEAASRVRTAEDALDSAVASLSGPKSISTVAKSSYDWDKFKETQQLEDELADAAKDGYLGRKDFLERVDERQFEQEKAERDVERTKRLARK